MRRMNKRMTSAVFAAGVASLALAACGAGDGSGGGRSDREKLEEYALKHAQCMREHGIDVPDPKPGQGLIMNGGIANPEAVERATRACEKEIGKPPMPELSAEDQREFREAALKHARCMREHGIDIPDPTFGANGEARIELKGGDGRGMGPDDPAFKAADEACRKYLGKGAITRSGGPGG
jgi:hypothetical protein